MLLGFGVNVDRGRATGRPPPGLPLVDRQRGRLEQVADLGHDGAAFRSSTAIDVSGSNDYAGWCSNCYTNAGAPFNSGVSTNVGGTWHLAGC